MRATLIFDFKQWLRVSVQYNIDGKAIDVEAWIQPYSSNQLNEMVIQVNKNVLYRIMKSRNRICIVCSDRVAVDVIM